RQGADLCLVEQGQNGLQGDIVDMRSIIVAPADVQAYVLWGNIGNRQIDGVDVQRHDFLKTLERVVLEVARPLHGKIGAVELQGQAPRVDKLIFAPHLPGERHDIVLV